MVNADNAVDYALAGGQDVFGEENCRIMPKPMRGAEDFAFFAKAVPSAFMGIGTGNPEKGSTWPAHHPKFDIDEDGLVNGVQILCNLALNMR